MPDGWVKTTTGEVAKSYVPGRNKPKVFDGAIPWITTPEITGRFVPDNNHRLFVDEVDIKNAGGKIVPRNCVIFSCVGDLGIVTRNTEPVVINQQLHAFEPRSNVDPEFFAYQLECAKPAMIALASTTTIPYLNKKNCESLPISLPPLPEQRKIADILSTWDAAIEKTDALLATAKAQKRALMQSLLTGKRRFPEFEGQEWKEVRLGDIADIRIGGTPARKEPTFWQGGNNIWLSIADMGPKHLGASKEQITDEGVAKSNVKLLPTGSVVMSFKLTIGKLGITAVPLYTNEAICGFVPRDTDSFDPEFLYQLLHVADLLQDVDQAVKGKTLNKAKLSEIHIDMPAFEEQRQIAEFLGGLDNDVQNWSDQATKLRTEKKALMQQLLTGKRRVVV